MSIAISPGAMEKKRKRKQAAHWWRKILRLDMFLTCTYTAVCTQIDVHIMHTAVCEIQQKASTKTDVTAHKFGSAW